MAATRLTPRGAYPVFEQLRAAFEIREEAARAQLWLLQRAAESRARLVPAAAAAAVLPPPSAALRRVASRVVTALGLALVVLGLALTLPAAVDLVSPDAAVVTGNATSATRTGFAIEAPLLGPPVAEKPAEPSAPAPPASLDLPRLGISAPVLVLRVDAEGTMQTPDRPDAVAWYDFSPRPGAGGNAVFAGHLDFARTGAAVFWRLRDARTGDEVVLRLADGALLRYQVSDVRTFDVATAPIGQIVGPTASDAITLITCAGRFDRRAAQYDQRLVVRAVRAP